MNSLFPVMTYKICYVNFMVGEFGQRVYGPHHLSLFFQMNNNENDL